MDDWVQALLGKKYSPNQPRDESGRFGSGGAISELGAVERSVESFEKEYRDSSVEHCRIIDSDGKTILQKTGTEDTIEFDTDELKSIKGATLTHNHPPPCESFSIEDVTLASDFGLSEIRATGIEGSTGKAVVYSLKPKKNRQGAWPKSSWIKTNFYNAEEIVNLDSWEKIRRGKLTPKLANEQHGHRAWSRIASKLGLEYKKEYV